MVWQSLSTCNILIDLLIYLQWFPSRPLTPLADSGQPEMVTKCVCMYAYVCMHMYALPVQLTLCTTDLCLDAGKLVPPPLKDKSRKQHKNTNVRDKVCTGCCGVYVHIMCFCF